MIRRMMANNFNVVAVGRAYTDIIFHASEKFLAAHQIPINGQRECSVELLKQIQQDLSPLQMIAGGPSANTTAIIAALGGKAGFFGKVYDDEAGKNFLEDCKQRNVVLCCTPFVKTPALTGTCLVFLTDNKRSFAYNPGCSDYFAVTDFSAFDFSISDFFLIEAHLLTSPVAKPAIMQAIKNAKNKTRIVINLHGITQWDNGEVMVHEIIFYADIIIGNHDEQDAFAQALGSLQVTQSASQLIVTTQGAKGAEISRAGQVLCHVPAVAPGTFVSSIGAGDAFIAGFLLAQASGMGIEESMRRGAQTAAAILEETGARPNRSLAHLFQVT